MTLERLKHLSEKISAQETEQSDRVLPSVHIFERREVTAFEAVVYNPVICLILQGRKEMNAGDRRVSLAEGDALLVSHDLPVSLICARIGVKIFSSASRSESARRNG